MAGFPTIPTENALQTTLDSTLNAGASSAVLADNWSTFLSGVSTSRPAFIVVDRVDVSGVSTPNKREYIKVTGVSGTTLTLSTRGLGGSSDQSHSVGAIVEIVFDISTVQQLIDCFATQHSATTGAHDFSASNVDFQGISLGAGTTITSILDEDDMASDSATALPTQQSVKAYVDAEISGISITPTQLNDTNGNEAIKTVATTSAVNELTVTNAATGGSPEISATGSDTNIHIAIKGKGDGLVKMAVLTQNNTTNAYKNNSVILTGWGFILGNSGVAMNESVTFGITFSEAPIVVIGGAGQRSGSDPSAIGDLNGQPGYVMTETYSITTTGFSAGLSRATTGAGSAQSFSNTIRYGYNWVAVGAFN